MQRPTPEPYQLEGAEWLAERTRAALCDEQGLGKTGQAILASDYARGSSNRWSVLICCPSVVLHNWKREWLWWSKHFEHVQVVERLDETFDPRATVVIISHRAVMEPAILKQVAKRTWNLTILDESHMFRNYTAQRVKAFYGIGRKWGVVAQSKRTWLLTGTPMPNDARDLFPMSIGMWPEEFPSPKDATRSLSFTEFRDRYCHAVQTRFGIKVLGNRNVAELRQRLAKHVLRRRKDVLDLPPVYYEEIALRPKRLPAELAKLDEKFAEVAPKYDVATDPEAALRAMRSEFDTATWRRLCGMAKVEPIGDLIEMENLPKVVVFAHHVDVSCALFERCTKLGLNPVMIVGETSPAKRQEAVDAFQSDPSVRVIVCQIIAGGTGITLTAASELLYAELDYVPGNNWQAADRIHRFGQTEACRVRYVSLAGTSDEQVVAILRRKVRMIRELCD